MDFALNIINSANLLIGCRTVRLDCRDALVDYYEKKGFIPLNRDGEKDLNRMVMILT